MRTPSRGTLPEAAVLFAIVLFTPAAVSARGPSLVWHAEFLDGRPVSSARADEPINPASVVKIATTWWAIETFGPDHRFETRFVADRDTTVAEGIVAGPLYVLGGADPDFHAENAFRVALSLNAHGIRRVEGDLWVDDFFWMGWENGSAGTERDPSRRATRMGARLRAAMDPNRWTPATRRSWQAFAAREKVPVSRPPSVRITGTIRRIDRDLTDPRLLVVHRSKPLVDTLRRFNCYSNNDIERVAAAEGAVRRIETFLAADLGDGVAVETASGLGHNRLTPRQIVGMLRQFRESAEAHRLEVEGLLGVAGCDPGTVTRFYPRFANGPNETSLVGKTGTLTTTDGGVSVLAGFLSTAEGEIVFAVASPGAGGRLNAARRSQEAWLLELLESHGGPVPRTCQPPLPLPDEGAEVEPFAPEPRPVG